jgi:hypothetical protein
VRDSLPEFEPAGYDRPNQPWTCGRAAEGEACAFGPGPKGVCPALAECKPVERDGQWQCDRSPVRGGACDHGPTPDGKCCHSHACKPVRNLRAVRGVLVRAMMIFVAGLSLMMLGSRSRDHWIAPGPLTSHHSQVLLGEGWEQRCNQCHGAAKEPVGTWLSAIVGSNIGPVQSTKCMDCHDKTISRDLALVAHNVPAEMLLKDGMPRKDEIANNLACAVCHQEHHGADHAISAMDNTRCQTCHTQQFESFATDHPDFQLWPYERRTRIAFNHSTHGGKYFAEKNKEFRCQQCHVEDDSRGVQSTLGFEASCAECHTEDIATTTASGVALVALPLLDVEALADAGHPVSNWPERASGDFDGRLPAMMKLLLARDTKAREAIEVLGPGFDFFDVDPDDEQQMAATATLVTAMEQMLDELATNKPADGTVTAGLPPALVDAARRTWVADSADSTADDRDPGSWWSDADSLSIRYQPRGHADPLLRAWFDAIVALDDAPLRDALLADFTGPAAPGRCTTCHSVEQTSGGKLAINWHANNPREALRSFTKFSHAPHLLPIELRDCTACHALAPMPTADANYTGFNPAVHTSDFHPVSKAMCATCHTRGAVGDSCTQCHNYHVQDWSGR